MAADDPTTPDDGDDIEPADVRAELDRQRTRARDGSASLEGGLVDLLSRAHDADTRTRIYVALRRHPRSTVEEIAEGTGLYPSAVDRVLSDLHEEGVVERDDASRTGDDEYTAVSPTGLVDVAFDRLRDGIDAAIDIDRSRDDTGRSPGGDTGPVTIPVTEGDADGNGHDGNE